MPRYVRSPSVSVATLTVTTGPLLLPDGTAGAPALAFSSDPNTGIRWSASGNFLLTGDGVDFARVGSGPGGIGLGTGSVVWGTTVGSNDLILTRDAANTLALRNGNNNQTMRFGTANAAYAQISAVNELHTLALAATSDTTITIPANSLVVGVTLRVTTTITGCSTIDVGVAGATTRYGTGIALASGTTNVSPGTTNPTIYSAATAIRFTAIGGGASFTAGELRVTVHYISLSAPTS